MPSECVCIHTHKYREDNFWQGVSLPKIKFTQTWVGRTKLKQKFI